MGSVPKREPQTRNNTSIVWVCRHHTFYLRLALTCRNKGEAALLKHDILKQLQSVCARSSCLAIDKTYLQGHTQDDWDSLVKVQASGRICGGTTEAAAHMQIP